MTIGAAPVGGVYFTWGGGFAKLLHDKMGIPGNVETTGGPVHNTQLLEAKQLDFGMVTAAPVYEGWHGLGWAKGEKHQNPKMIFPMYASYLHAYALKKSGIKSIHEIETTHEVNIFGVPKADAEKFIAKYPFFSTGIIPKGMYKANRDFDIETVAVWNFMAVHKDAPGDFVI
ncbi:MAG: TAXI family TRAP transporter solute-binding subunit [Deltaproteobacteria bacterium]|nr:TAXI family TRAP transporter solute-binding subunit [Deltaproteobacteria bacterium]